MRETAALWMHYAESESGIAWIESIESAELRDETMVARRRWLDGELSRSGSGRRFVIVVAKRPSSVDGSTATVAIRVAPFVLPVLLGR